MTLCVLNFRLADYVTHEPPKSDFTIDLKHEVCLFRSDLKWNVIHVTNLSRFLPVSSVCCLTEPAHVNIYFCVECILFGVKQFIKYFSLNKTFKSGTTNTLLLTNTNFSFNFAKLSLKIPVYFLNDCENFIYICNNPADIFNDRCLIAAWLLQYLTSILNCDYPCQLK